MSVAQQMRKKSNSLSVCLPGSVAIDQLDLVRVSGIYPIGSNDGSYLAEFLDEQTAQRYEKLAQRARQAARLPPSTAVAETLGLGPEPSSMPLPFQSKSTQQQIWNGFAHPPAAAPTQMSTHNSRPAQKGPAQIPMSAQNGHVVDIKGLPRHLMSRPMLEAILDQGGLDKTVVDFTLSKPDSAQIHLANQEAVDTCISHFHGRRWGTEGVAVTAKAAVRYVIDECLPSQPAISKVQSKAEAAMSKDRHSTKPKKVTRGAPSWSHTALFKELKGVAPWVHPADAKFGRVGGSDASTTVSDEDHEASAQAAQADADQDWWAGELKWTGNTSMKMCF